MMIYILIYQPFEDRKRNIQEQLNEFYFYLITFCFVPFTDHFRLSYKLKDKIGYFMIGLTGFYLTQNILSIVVISVKNFC